MRLAGCQPKNRSSAAVGRDRQPQFPGRIQSHPFPRYSSTPPSHKFGAGLAMFIAPSRQRFCAACITILRTP
jgi:hypothetical protein